MLNWCVEFAKSQPVDEIRGQYAVADFLETRRRLLGLIPFAVAAIYMPVWLCLVLAMIDTVLEFAGIRMLGKVDPGARPYAYIMTLGCFGAAQIVYMILPILIWIQPDPFAKACAVAMFMITLLHISTVRAVHLPLALVSLAVATLSGLVGNACFLILGAASSSVALTTACIMATAYFAQITITTVHGLHKALSRDRRAAEDANDAKSRFLAQMSHELRTPLNAILGMGYAEQTNATAASKDRLSVLVQSARSLSVLLDDILDMSAVQAGKLPIRPTVINLRAEITAATALFRQQISDSNMQLRLDIDDLLPECARIDGQRFRQCLSNLLSNAIKYAPQGSITLTVTAPRFGMIAVEVCDTGPGVPAALHERIFEPFHRGDSAEPGTGLGLSISRTLARRMGGDLTLLPAVNGARFYLTLAIMPAVASEMPVATPANLADLTGRLVLVVDDIATNRLVAMTYLRIMGAVAVEAGSGPAALAFLAINQPDFVLLDMLMPGMDGIETLRCIRNLPGPGAAVPVIAMTADATDERWHHYLASGLDGYVSKPLSPELLSAAATAVLSKG